MPKKKRKSTDAQIRASMKWAASNVRQMKFNLNLDTDADIIEKLDALPNKQGYIKAALRAYMEKE